MVRDARRRAPHHGERKSLIQPHILKSQIVVLAVGVRPKVLHMRLPAIAGGAVQDHRTRGVLDQHALDLPDQLRALFPVELARLRGQQLVDLGVAVWV